MAKEELPKVEEDEIVEEPELEGEGEPDLGAEEGGDLGIEGEGEPAPGPAEDGSESDEELVEALINSFGMDEEDAIDAAARIFELGYTTQEAIDDIDNDEIAAILSDYESVEGEEEPEEPDESAEAKQIIMDAIGALVEQDPEAAEAIMSLVQPHVKAKSVETAEGNPLAKLIADFRV
jgi:hypothetical protein